MGNPNDVALLSHLVELTRQAAGNDYSHVEELFELTRKGRSSEIIRELAEAFGMMVVQVEGREFRLEQLIEDLKQANRQLEAALQKVKASDMAKQKVIDHLSHELKTPLAIISGAFHRLADTLPENDHPNLTKTIDRGLRNVTRLMAVQEKVDDIINNTVESTDKPRYLRLIEEFADMVEDLSEKEAGIHRRLLDRISARIESIYQVVPVTLTTVRLDQFIENACSKALQAASSRDVKLTTNFEPDLFVDTDPSVLAKVIDGLLKNAIENTPDGGAVHISAVSNKGEVVIVIRDTGVGIAPEDQKNIFGGFFHTQDTEKYSTKRPYQFNAGGTGSDLLRIKVFSERFKFKVALSSRRCNFLQTEGEQCPGRISACQHVRSEAECDEAGSTEFTLRFDKKLKARG